MTERDPEDITFRECMEYLESVDIPHDIRCKVAGYFGTYGSECWQRGLKEGIKVSHD